MGLAESIFCLKLFKKSNVFLILAALPFDIFGYLPGFFVIPLECKLIEGSVRHPRRNDAIPCGPRQGRFCLSLAFLRFGLGHQLKGNTDFIWRKGSKYPGVQPSFATSRGPRTSILRSSTKPFGGVCRFSPHYPLPTIRHPLLLRGFAAESPCIGGKCRLKWSQHATGTRLTTR